ncbi:hypothetical protein [Pantoea phage PA-1]
MSYIFLIIVISSNTSNQQIIPMDSMQQCNAALKALELVKEKRTGWNDFSPRVDNAHCVEVPNA